MEARKEKLNGVVLFAAGSLIGAGVALLFAPQSGKRTRRDIRHAIDSLVDDVSESMHDGMNRGREWTENTTQGVIQALNSGKDFIRKELANVMSRGA
jgi:gas vesicle protein